MFRVGFSVNAVATAFFRIPKGIPVVFVIKISPKPTEGFPPSYELVIK